MAADDAPRAKVPRALVCFGAAHLAAYPIAAVWAIGLVPAMLPLLDDAIRAAGDGEAALLGVPMPANAVIVVRAMLELGLAVFALVHAAGLVWFFAETPAVGRRRFAWIAGGALAAGVVLGAASWIWLVLRAKA
jgi:hypothetical protein